MSKLTLDEWTTLYALQFGRYQTIAKDYMEGEEEFVTQMVRDLYPNGEDDNSYINAYILLSREFRRRDNERSKEHGGVRPEET
jgi:hypothetical protein